MQHIIKRQGHKEKFDERKVYASCYAACLSTHMERTEAEMVCERVCKDMKQWITKKKEVTSDDLFKQITRAIRNYSHKAAFMYETHRDIS